MPCFKPLQGYRSQTTNENTGRRSIVFNPKLGFSDMPVQVPCGQCIGCRLERSRQWAMRCIHEASLYSDNCFITLTYNEENLPLYGSLVLKDYQLFMKRLRKKFAPRKIRFFHCGEYGDETSRPHYHACLFNIDFPDRKLYSCRNNVKLYTSEILSDLWPHGFATVGDVTFESAAYVARYIMKKVTGENAENHYQTADIYTGELNSIEKEYVTMSRRPGIGKGWYEAFKPDAYPSDYIIVNGVKMRPPKFYDTLLEREHREAYELIKLQRQKEANKHKANNTTERLRVRETVKKAQMKFLKRTLE